MKILLLVLSIILVSALFFLTQNAFAENLFYGSSSFEKLPSTISDEPSNFELKIRYTEGPYAITKLTPVFDVSPKDAKPYVQIETKLIDGLYRNDVGRIQGTITVDPQIQYEKVFVSVYFNGMDSYNNSYKSAWMDSATIDIKKQTVSSDSHNAFSEMNYSQYLDFCDKYNPALWDSMSIEERLTSNLCDFNDKGFDEKQWNWLSGTKLDWKSFAQNKTEEYATNLALYKEHGIKDSLIVKTLISLRESFPPPMSATISFDYMSGSETKQYKKEFMVGISGLNERTDNILSQKTENFIGNDLVPSPISSPLQQFKSGIPIDQIQCKEGFARVIKLNNDIPICVKSGTVPKLVERGVISNTFDTTNNSGLVIPRGDLLTQNDTHGKITILSISPQNVTLPEPKKQTPKTTCTHGACFTPE